MTHSTHYFLLAFILVSEIVLLENKQRKKSKKTNKTLMVDKQIHRVYGWCLDHSN